MATSLRLAVLGDPISHSRSPAIHGAAIRHLGLEGGYEARRAGPEELMVAIGELRQGTLQGINITMPLKREAAHAAGLLTEEARVSGSVNTLRFREGVVEGHSTDVVAARAAFTDPRFRPDAPILILGSGGAAAAVLAAAGDRDVYLAARNQDRAANLVAFTNLPASIVPFGTSIVGALVVNATPLGMRGELLPEATIGVASGLVDLAYGHDPTPAVTWAEGTGLPVMDGVEYLVLQAASSFEWWTGLVAPFEVMLESARKL